MSEYDAYSNEDFVRMLECCEMPAGSFHHVDHVRLAWLYLRERPLDEAVSAFEKTLKRFATHHGASDKYHATITWAFLFLIHDRMNRPDAPDNWPAFAAANPALLAWPNGELDRYYSRETIASARAKRSFVLPDKLAS